uniref:Uncharacterized protein n=1 Tax=Meloidogyne enterolobii TaxID=390850 RepID=A0A6V7WQA2_MELEN|nr:unnamed protein product [Meloidogyne enterolobii]
MSMFWGFLPFFYFIVNMFVFVALQCCCKKKKVKKVLKRRGISANEKQKVEVKKGNKKKKKNGPNGKAQKPLNKSKENNKDEKEMPTAISSEHQSNNEKPSLKSKTKTKTGVFTGSVDTSTPTALAPMIGEIGGEKKVSAVLTAFAEKEKKEAEKKFPMEEDIDDHPDYDTLQFADKKDVFKTGFTSKGVRIEKEAPQKKLKPGDSAYMDDGVV